jgi:prevent-host-death family protein
MAPQRVGVRELKTRLGAYLRQVRQGRTLVVTDRGDPIAELRPLGTGTDAQAVLATLDAVGAVTRPTRSTFPPFRPITRRGGGSAAAAVLEDRDDRF